jgi:hypothetical protein
MTTTKRVEEIVGEYKSLMGCEVMTVWDERTGDEVFLPDWLRTTLHQELQKAREEEREKLFKNPMELFRGNRIKMTVEAREALLNTIDVINDQSELDQPTNPNN